MKSNSLSTSRIMSLRVAGGHIPITLSCARKTRKDERQPGIQYPGSEPSTQGFRVHSFSPSIMELLGHNALL